MEREDLDARLARIEDAFVFEGTRHFTLQATGTLFRLKLQGF
jgi:hypothetical protein